MKAESVYTGNKMTGYSLLGYGPTSQARSTIRACGNDTECLRQVGG